MDIFIPNRSTAGKALANRLLDQVLPRNSLVLALPRGGVPVAYEIATRLDLELDLLLVRKLGMPGQREVAMGAIASGDIQFLNDELIEAHRIPQQQIASIVLEERTELERRRRSYRGTRSEPVLQGRAVILVDDGLATGASMRVAVDAVKRRGAAHIVVAVPVGAVQALDHLKQLVDGVVCLTTPVPFFSVGQWYREFPQVSDHEVKALLEKAWARNPATAEKDLRKVM